MTAPPDPWPQPASLVPDAPPGPTADAAARPSSLTAAYLVAVLASLASIGLMTATYLAAKSWLDGLVSGRITEIYGGEVTHDVKYVAGYGTTISLVALIVLLVLFLGLTALWLGLGVKMTNGSRRARGLLTFLAVSWLVFDLGELVFVVAGFSVVHDFLVQNYAVAWPGSFQVLGLAQVGVTALGAAAYLVLAYRPAASAYLDARRPAS